MADLRHRGGRGVLSATTDQGVDIPLKSTGEGHLEVAIHGPRLPFGSIHTESLTPILQADASYGLNAQLISGYSALSGGYTAANGLFECSTGTTQYGFGVLQSRKRLRYRPGQGIVGRFTAIYTAPAASSYQLAGYGSAEAGLYFGYKDTQFGVLHVTAGVREVRTLTISTASTTAETITVTLADVNYNVAVTNSASTIRTAYEISRGTFGNWQVEQVGSTVRFLSRTVGPKAGVFSVTATTAVGSFATTLAGVNTTDIFVPQTEWNGDKLDGTGLSGATLDPSKLNVFQIKATYLGGGPFIFEVMLAASDNNPEWTTVHVIRNVGTRTTPTLTNPSFPFTMAAYSAGATTNLVVKSASFAGFVEGPRALHSHRFTFVNSLTTVGATNYQALFTIQNKLVYSARANQAVAYLLSVSGALKHTSPCIYYLIKNGTLAGTPNFADHSTNSACLVDTAATTVTFSSNEQLLWTGHLGDTGDLDHHFNGTGTGEQISLQPGEWVTLAARAATGTPSYVTGSINIREDQ